jgi:hypothetical protein
VFLSTRGAHRRGTRRTTGLAVLGWGVPQYRTKDQAKVDSLKGRRRPMLALFRPLAFYSITNRRVSTKTAKSHRQENLYGSLPAENVARHRTLISVWRGRYRLPFAICQCGWRGQLRLSLGVAYDDARAHSHKTGHILSQPLDLWSSIRRQQAR